MISTTRATEAAAVRGRVFSPLVFRFFCRWRNAANPAMAASQIQEKTLTRLAAARTARGYSPP
jgi:hypothetical protein